MSEDKKQEQMSQLMELLSTLTIAALTADKDKWKKDTVSEQLKEIINQLPEAPETEPLRAYFEFLLAKMEGKATDDQVEKLPEPLKELYESLKKQLG